MRMLLALLLLAAPPDDEINAPVKDAVAAEVPSLVDLYKWFHTNVELSLKEEKTSAKFAAEVKAAGWTVTEKIGGYGVVASLQNGEGPTILLRIDMDGLPVKEETGLPYVSANPGAMHACGHDSHLAMGIGGARVMLEDPKFGAAIPSKPSACLSVHDFTGKAGTLGVCPGFASANTDALD